MAFDRSQVVRDEGRRHHSSQMQLPLTSSLTLGVDRRLARKLFQHLRRAREPVTRLPDGAVKH